MKKLFLLLFFISNFVFAASGNQIIKASPPLTLTNGLMAMPSATSSRNGYLSLTDWTTFNNKQPSVLTTKGDLLGFSSALARLAVGTNGQVLSADSTSPLGIKWADAAAGGVTSVGLTLPNIFSVSGSPVTTSGTLSATLANESANLVFAGPSSGSPAAPSFRALVPADLPVQSPVSIGNSGSAFTYDCSLGSYQRVTLTASPSVTLSNCTAGQVYGLEVNSGGGSFNINWPTTVQWPAQNPPTITTTANRLDLISLTYNGTVYLGNISQNYNSQPALINTKSLNLGTSNTTKYVDFGNNYNFSFSSSFTVSGWVYIKSGANVLFSKEDNTGTGWDLSYQTSSLVFYWSGNAGAARLQVTTTGTFAADNWYHVALTYPGTSSASDIKIYVNGANQTLTINHNATSGTGTSAATFDIGSYNSGAGSFFHGAVNQFAVANGTALSSGQIAQLYNAGHPVDISQLNIANLFTSWWYLNQTDSASTVTDHIGAVTGTGVNLVSGDYTTNVP